MENKKLEFLINYMRVKKEEITESNEQLQNKQTFLRRVKVGEEGISQKDYDINKEELLKQREAFNEKRESVIKFVNDSKKEIIEEKQLKINEVEFLEDKIAENKSTIEAEIKAIEARKKDKEAMQDKFKEVKEANMKEVERLRKDSTMTEEEKKSKMDALKYGTGDIDQYFAHIDAEIENSENTIKSLKEDNTTNSDKLNTILNGKRKEDYTEGLKTEIQAIEKLNFQNIDEIEKIFEGKSAEPKAKPESTAEPKAKPESTAEPKVKPESTAEPKAKPESTAEPKAKPESTAEPKAKPETTAERKEKLKSVRDVFEKVLNKKQQEKEPVELSKIYYNGKDQKYVFRYSNGEYKVAEKIGFFERVKEKYNLYKEFRNSGKLKRTEALKKERILDANVTKNLRDLGEEKDYINYINSAFYGNEKIEINYDFRKKGDRSLKAYTKRYQKFLDKLENKRNDIKTERAERNTEPKEIKMTENGKESLKKIDETAKRLTAENEHELKPKPYSEVVSSLESWKTKVNEREALRNASNSATKTEKGEMEK